LAILVDLVVHYSNLSEQGELLKECLEIVPKGPYLDTPLPVQGQHRLENEETDALAAAYISGATVNDLAGQFQVHRSTVDEILSRKHVPRRRRGLTDDQIGSIISLYAEGWSLKQLGEHFGFHSETVGAALKQEGVVIRRRWG
jgi:lambda repressor-like predicted transcriptional regulator